MPSRVLYHCPCSTGPSPYVGSTIASSSCHLLPSLYFCEECDSIRCNLCTQNEVAVYYCPSCLFDVPAAGIKSERSRCARNCFQCPVCANILAVTPSDLGSGSSSSAAATTTSDRLFDGLAASSQDDWNPRSAQASVGEPPYYLTCSACKWDSKEIGMVFEKSTGLSLQVQRHEETAEDVTEFNHLRSHFDAYLRMTTEHQQQQSNTMTHSAAIRSSKLLRDVPSLANDPVFMSRRHKQPKAEAIEELKPYISVSGKDAAGKPRKQRRDGKGEELSDARDTKEFLVEQEDEMEVSGLTERWQSLADQSVRVGDLRPNRVPLKTKQTKRCPACRHIIIKAEPKAQSSRYKIKLMALNYLPEIQINPLLPLGSSMATLEDRRRSSALLTSRRRDLAVKVDEENLHPGRTYLFEASFVNPLDDAMTITLHIAKNACATQPTTSEADVVLDSDISPSKRQAMREAAEWGVTPTTSTFPVSAFNEVWELDQEDNDLINSVSKNSSARGGQSERGATDDADDDDELDDDLDDALDDDKYPQKGKTGGEKKKKGDGILRRRGHETTIGLELALGRSVPRGDIQFAMQVTYRYMPGAAEEQQRGKGESTKSFSFWTVIRLGRVSGDGSRVTASGMPALSAEARRSALDKRRSIMGINVNQTNATPSTLTSLRESGDVF